MEQYLHVSQGKQYVEPKFKDKSILSFKYKSYGKNSKTHRDSGNLSINFLGKLTMGQTQDNQELIGEFVKELTWALIYLTLERD